MILARMMEDLAGQLDAAGAFGSPAWRDAFFRVPRHRFIPDVIWVPTSYDDRYLAVSRSVDPEAWMALVLADKPVITQADDGKKPAAAGARADLSTSSASQPSLVFAMLAELDLPAPGGRGAPQRVLELGTGTGYNAGLLCACLGPENVTTVEADTHLARAARDNLSAIGYSPAVVNADGAGGCPSRAPFSRVIATYAVEHIPYAWVQQTAPGGLLLIPWGSTYFNGALLRLERDPDGTAHGMFTGPAAFMRDRNARPPAGPLSAWVPEGATGEDSVTGLDPGLVCDNPDAEFFIGLLVSGVQQRVFAAPDGSGEFTLWLIDAAGSWACADYVPGKDSFAVTQHGPRRLWDEVAAAHARWELLGRPARGRFGVSAGPHGQRVWLDDPGRARL